MKKGLVFICSLFIFLETIPAQPKYEFRAAWIATVVNIDWPSKKGLDVATQKAEYIFLLDSLQQLHMNAVVVQVRTAADAFFPSPYEPWSEYLNGIQGQAPVPYYDPLQFMIEESHKRNMEFHAWLNPYRAVFDNSTSSISPTHITRTHKEWFLTYGTKKYFNPGLPEVQQYVTNIVKDIITRYDVDAIHMDDYFYPYRIAGKEFPDAASYKKYGKGLPKEAWRRSNCDSIIKMIHVAVLQTKPFIKFGISPFGVWRNISKDKDGSNTQAGQTNYDDLYADILLWLQQGWIDYVAPQLYWEIGHHLCDYNILLNWWGNHSYGKQVYIGHGIYRAVERPTLAWRNPNELPNQIKNLRNNPNVQGSIYYSCTNLLHNPNGWADSLAQNYYQYPALVPPMDYIDVTAPLSPNLQHIKEENKKQADAAYIIKAKPNDSVETEEVKTYVLYLSNNFKTLGNQPIKLLAAKGLTDIQFTIPATQIPNNGGTCYIAITAVDRENNESPLSNVQQLIKTNKGWVIPKQ
ncbi:glycoside hydrolase family 10 protein [Limnovirga soli]|uniref:Family 10 glycosylhydrolase n=1 Tax=Limnovirga soli TaxID=2656915 RepID=A0A8J8FI72_9BACT|nr:family 10 glycosylhydrolase [Limnovirga soli]NNV56804.1 family 10 glycosylhydrolase [Limnovirga soli]